jgi:hypothetical protein
MRTPLERKRARALSIHLGLGWRLNEASGSCLKKKGTAQVEHFDVPSPFFRGEGY